MTTCPTVPPRLPIVLIKPIAAAAAPPERNCVGILHIGGFAALIPKLANESPIIRTAMLPADPAISMPTDPAKQAIEQCSIRSFRRSELLPHQIMPTAATRLGIAASRPRTA